MATGSNVTFTAATGITLQAGFTVEAGAEFLAEIAQPAGPPTGLPRDYVGGIEYYNGVMEAIYHAEGRVSFDNGQSLYEYNLTDHLGNLRLSFADRNGDGDVDITSDPATNEILQEHHYYPFGMAMEGDWVDNPVKVNRYLYNGKELESEFGLNLYAYGARYYDPTLGRFTGVDPIADQFAWVSEYNYAENEPVAHIDLHGLQKVRFDKNALNNRTFQSAEALNRGTSGGQRFKEALDSQNKIDVVYAVIPRIYDGVTSGPFGSFEEFKEARAKSPALKTATNSNWEEYENYFEDGREVMVIAAYCDDDCSNESIRSTALNINHEEVAHGINRLLGIEKSLPQEHLEFNGEASNLSPNDEDIKNDPKYKDTEAKKQMDEIDKMMGNNE